MCDIQFCLLSVIETQYTVHSEWLPSGSFPCVFNICWIAVSFCQSDFLKSLPEVFFLPFPQSASLCHGALLISKNCPAKPFQFLVAKYIHKKHFQTSEITSRESSSCNKQRNFSQHETFHCNTRILNMNGQDNHLLHSQYRAVRTSVFTSQFHQTTSWFSSSSALMWCRCLVPCFVTSTNSYWIGPQEKVFFPTLI